MNDDIKFLKELQDKLKYQSQYDYDCQAAPRFWTVGDYKTVDCAEGRNDGYEVYCPNQDTYGKNIDDLLDDIKEEDLHEMPSIAVEQFQNIECETTALEWLQEYFDEDAELVPVREEHFVRSDTMFLTKEEAKRHIKLNHYHYSAKAHTYAMTAWRAPEVSRLLDVLENFDWDSVVVAN